MIDYVIDRHRDAIEAVVVVVQPAHRSLAENHLRDAGLPVAFAEQLRPTGMLDAVTTASKAVLAFDPARIRITWCDQVGISPGTVRSLEQLELDRPDEAVIMPVVNQPSPYIHFERDAEGRLAAVRHRREGDVMPETGTSDAGLFSLSRDAFERWLPVYARDAATGARTGERNFLPFVPWAAARGSVHTFEIPAEEAQGINTPQDLADVEQRIRTTTHGR